MAKAITCESCGATNDVIFDFCLYCNKPLDNADMDTISNEDLFSMASEWVEKIHNEHIEVTSENKNGRMVKKLLDNGEIKSYAKKYLYILKYRAIRSPELNPLIDGLETRFSEVSKTYKKNIVGIVLGIFIGSFVFFLLLNFLLQSSDNDAIESKRINKKIEQVSELIANKNYDEALIQVEQVKWNYLPEKRKKEVENTDKQREELKSTILMLKKSGYSPSGLR